MSGGQSAKGNPATRRMGNAHRKAHRAAMWAKEQKRKTERNEAEKARAKALAKSGETGQAWANSKARRSEARKDLHDAFVKGGVEAVNNLKSRKRKQREQLEEASDG